MTQRNLITIEIDTFDKVPRERLDAICNQVLMDAMRAVNDQGVMIDKAISSFYQPKTRTDENTDNRTEE